MTINLPRPPRTTIVIPTFNRANVVRRAIESALSQSVPCEVIVVDHGSSDDTPLLADEFGSRITYLRRDVDLGPIYCWVDGVMNSKTEFVKLLFDDDFLEPQFVEECETLMTSTTGFVLSQANIVDLNSNKVISTMFRVPPNTSGTYRVNSKLGRIIERSMVSPTALLVRKSDAVDSIFLGKLPFQRYEYHGAGADHFLKLYAMLKYDNFGYVATSLAYFGSHPSSITINALESETRRRALRRTYKDVWAYYRLLKKARYAMPLFRVSGPIDLFRRLKSQAS